MPTIQQQYTEFAQRSQEAALAVVDAWTQSVTEAVGRFPSVLTPAAAEQAIDQAFDLAVKVADIQRNVAKQLVNSTSAFAEEAVQRVTAAATEATEAATAVASKARKTEE